MPPVDLSLSSPPFNLDGILNDDDIEEVSDDKLCMPDDPVEDLNWFPALFDDPPDFNPPSKGGGRKRDLHDALTNWRVPTKRKTRQVGRKTWCLEPPRVPSVWATYQRMVLILTC